MSRRLVAAAVLTIAAASAWALPGCSSPPRVRLEPDPAGYHAYGAYIGSKSNVKLFVESFVYLEKQKNAIHVALAILNERPEPIRFDVASNRISIGTRTLGAEGSQMFAIRPFTIERVKLEFRTHMPPETIDTGTVHVEGIEAGPDVRIAFDVPFRRKRSVEELEAEE